MVLAFMAVRIIQLLISRLPLNPLLFVAPRGLITILLFLYISPENSIDIVNKSLIIQVIILTVLVMTFGLMFSGNKKEDEAIHEEFLKKNLLHQELTGALSGADPKTEIDHDPTPDEAG